MHDENKTMSADEYFDSSFEEINMQSEEQPDTTNQVELFELKHLGETIKADRDEIITLAQKGMDYDRIRSKYEQLKTKAALADGDPAALKCKEEVEDFLENYPAVDAASIPAEVWIEVQKGRTLTSAYMKWENQQLKTISSAVERNGQAEFKSTGSRTYSGKEHSPDDFLRYLFDD